MSALLVSVLPDAPGQAQAMAGIANAIGIASALVGLFFFMGVVVAAVEAQAAAAAGRPGVLITVSEKLLPAFVLMIIAYQASTVASQLSALAVAPNDAAGMVKVYVSIVTALVRAMLMSAGAWLSIGLATGTIAAQWANGTGRPGALAIVMERGGMVVVTAALALGAAEIATQLIRMAASR